ncbi:hypothetical protein [Desulfuromonas thiophila]|uniref:hypothetical protein n=1 Tax=Desulfuromonas thiophila TaxID=57664 RepID=UPI0029F4B67A|nr:hypothetical protein [Desulfuromonas thiophila]
MKNLLKNSALKALVATALLSLTGVSSAFAASTAGRSDHSGILVWAFLGFCALIVVAQLLPALLVILGVVKSTATDSQKAHASHKGH